VSEHAERAVDGTPYYVCRATEETSTEAVKPLTDAIGLMVGASAVALELSATYDAYREAGHSHVDALERLTLKKGSKCTPDNLRSAFQVLKQLGLPVD
jgi:hypothetical protein